MLYDGAAETLSALAEEAAETEQALDAAAAEQRAALQERLDGLHAQQRALTERPGSWMYYEPALTAYRETVVPNLFTAPCRLLELAQQTHASVWDELAKAVQQYLEGLTSLEQCVQRLGQIARTVEMEA